MQRHWKGDLFKNVESTFFTWVSLLSDAQLVFEIQNFSTCQAGKKVLFLLPVNLFMAKLLFFEPLMKKEKTKSLRGIFAKNARIL
jgi:hypothetical protein